jgi:hypothetical protein
MITLTRETIFEWLSDSDKFSYEFMRHSIECRRAIGINLSFIRTELLKAHEEWVETCDIWKATYFQQDVESLSFTKMLAILLYCLSKRTFISEMKNYEQTGHRSEHSFGGSEADLEEERADFVGAPEIVCALDFCLSAINFYEANRIDKIEPFEFRLTPSARHDLIHVLGSHGQDAMSVYIALEALYARN